MTTNPTNVPNKNQPHQGTPPLPFLHVSVDSNSLNLEIRIVGPRKVMWVAGNRDTVTVSDYAVRHGLLGIDPSLQLIEKRNAP